MRSWQQSVDVLKGKRIVIHHRDFIYLFDWLGIEVAGVLEPKPGLPTSARYLSKLKRELIENKAELIVHTPYQNPRAAKRLSDLLNIPVVELPYSVSENETETKDLFALFNSIISKLKGHIN